MRLVSMRHLSGPNIYTSKPASLARLELGRLAGVQTTDRPGFADALAALLPGLAGHHCAAGRPGGFLERLAGGTYFGHVAEHVALELSALCGRDVHLGRTSAAGGAGSYDVMMECPHDEPAASQVPARLVETAITVIEDLLSERTVAGRVTWTLADTLDSISATFERERLGVSTAAIAAAARRRGIPVRRVGDRSLLRLGYGCHRRLVCAALTEQTSVVGADIAADKMLAKQLLAGAGIPVPDGVVARSEREAAEALDRLGAPVVVKPLGGRQGTDVTVGVTTAEAAASACRLASAGGDAVLVEEFVPGNDYRVLVVDGQVVAAAQLRPAAVTGDGAADIAALVQRANADPRRGEGHARELTRIRLDGQALAHLAASGLGPASVPAAGEAVTLRRNANLSTGGTSADVTDQVHDEVAEMCRRAAAAVGLDVCGIDVRLADIGAPLLDGGSHKAQARPGGVVEVNACPGLRMHLAPAEGTPRDVAGAVVDRLYPPGAQSRVPVIAVTGTNGKTSTVRMVGHILRQAGLRVGMSTTDGVYCGGRLVYDADASGPRSAEMVLDDTTVEAAVLETARGGIIRGGLGYDLADVAVVTNISADHLGADGVKDINELADVKALVAEEVRDGGTVVLNADDPVTAALAGRPRVRRHAPVVRYVSLDPGNPVTRRHRQAGGLTCELRDGQLVEFDGDSERVLASVAEVPGAFGGRAPHVVANALAAVAACRAAGVSAKDIRRGLATFSPAEANPGRGNLYLAGGSPVIVDYGHNAAALAATGQMIRAVWGAPAPPAPGHPAPGHPAPGHPAPGHPAPGHPAPGHPAPGHPAGARQPAAAITLPGDRRDDLVASSAAAVAARFGAVAVYEDCDKRGRRPGEMQNLIIAAMREVAPDVRCERADGPADALRRTLAMACGGPVLFLYEKLAMARDALAEVGAQPWPADLGPAPAGPADLGPAPAGPAPAYPANQACLEPAAPSTPAPPPAAAGQTARFAPAPPLWPPHRSPAPAPTHSPAPAAAGRATTPPDSAERARNSRTTGPLRRADRPDQWNRGHW